MRSPSLKRPGCTLQWLLLISVFSLLLYGCRQEQKPAPPAAGAAGGELTSAPTTRSEPGPAGPVPVDDQDAPEAPRALPKSTDLAGWTKTRPIRVVSPSELAGNGDAGEHRLPDAESLAAVLDALQARRIAVCAYEHAVDRTTADVVLAEMSASQDAFAALALQTAATAAWDPVQSCFTAEDGPRILGCKADVYVEIRVPVGAEEKVREAARDLLKRVLFVLPAVDAPLLIRAMPPEHLADTKVWLVRSMADFRLADAGDGAGSAASAAGAARSLQTLRAIDAHAMDARLGLTGDVWLSVAAVPLGGGERPNLVWLVQHADAATARQTHAAYQKKLDDPSMDLDVNTIIQQPRGRILIGSWTADQESLQNLLPRLRERLPV